MPTVGQHQVFGQLAGLITPSTASFQAQSMFSSSTHRRGLKTLQDLGSM